MKQCPSHSLQYVSKQSGVPYLVSASQVQSSSVLYTQKTRKTEQSPFSFSFSNMEWFSLRSFSSFPDYRSGSDFGSTSPTVILVRARAYLRVGVPPSPASGTTCRPQRGPSRVANWQSQDKRNKKQMSASIPQETKPHSTAAETILTDNNQLTILPDWLKIGNIV